MGFVLFICQTHITNNIITTLEFGKRRIQERKVGVDMPVYMLATLLQQSIKYCTTPVAVISLHCGNDHGLRYLVSEYGSFYY